MVVFYKLHVFSLAAFAIRGSSRAHFSGVVSSKNSAFTVANCDEAILLKVFLAIIVRM
jgi:hypothetical protein